MSLSAIWSKQECNEDTEKRKSSKWNDHEINYLLGNYATNSISDIALALGRSYGSVAAKAHKIRRENIDIGRAGSKVAGRFSNREWTRYEINTLIGKYGKAGAVKMSKSMGRTDYAIRHKVKELRGKGVDIKVPNRWSKCEEGFIIDNYEHMTMMEISVYLGRSFGSVQSKIKRMGIMK